MLLIISTRSKDNAWNLNLILVHDLMNTSTVGQKIIIYKLIIIETIAVKEIA